MNYSFAIRPVVAGDFAQWQALWEGYNRFYQRSVPPTITQLTWSRFFDPAEPVHALVADQDGELLGLAHSIFHRNTTLAGSICYLQDLFTAEHARGRGVGRALIEGVYAQARDSGAERVYWHTHETNATAMLLYDKVAERSGFVVYRKQL
jgi:GNAT superfamily N-acetyltransferase